MTTLVEASARHCTHELFEAQAVRSPAAIAVESGDRLVTYRELNHRANQLAHHLIALGVRPETLVGVVLDRTPETLIALLAIMKAGGAYVPLDPALPLDRRTTMLADAEVGFLVTGGGPRETVLPGVRVVDTAAERDRIERRPTDNPDSGVRPENLAYCIYTSGSTGRPKAVAVPSGNLSNQVTCMTAALGIRPGDRLLQFTSIAMDAALQEIFPAWLGGGTLVLQPERVPSVTAFMRLLDELAVSVVSVPSSYWHHWVDELVRRPARPPRALRMVYVGGERILADRLRQWHSLGWSGQVGWLADYGPTETTLSSLLYTGLPEPEWQTVPIGRPIDGMRAYVLDEDQEPVAPGVVGEVHLAGVGVSRGYLNRQALTAEKFVPDPFGPPGARMYRTGDLGHELPDGQVQFVGRRDHQVKVNGHRIELGDVESALRRCDGVRDAIVLAREDAPGEPRLVAYTVGDGTSETALRARLAELLPPPMIPAAFVAVAEFPRSPVTGKLDRARLPDPRSAAQPAGPAPDSDVELTIAVLFAEVIGRPPRSRDEDFFAAGGDSLRALRLLDRVAAAVGVEMTFTDFARKPTIRALASARSGAPVVNRLAPRSRSAGRARRPASRAQQRLWFLDRFRRGTATYSIPLAYRIRGPVSMRRIDAALTAIVARHEALRTRLTADENGTLWQEVVPPEPVHARFTPVDSPAEALRLAGEEAGTPIPLDGPSLVRASCFGIGDEDVVFVLNVHHAVFDAWSLGVFWPEFRAEYAGERVAEPPFQYVDYAEWQNEWLSGPEAAEQRRFWREKLAGDLPLLHFPAARGVPGGPDGAMEPVRTGPRLREAVRGCARRHGTTEFAVLLAGFLATLYRHTRQEQLVVGVPVACRSLAGAEDVVGYFTNTVALRMFFDPELTFAQLLERTANELAEVMTRQELPFDEVVDSLSLPRQGERSPVYQAMFVMQDTLTDQTPRIDGLEVEELPVHSGTAKADLTCALRTGAAGYTGELEYSTALFDRSAATGWLDSFQTLLADAAERPSASLEGLRLASPGHQEAAVARINEDRETYPDPPTLHAGFEQLAKTMPEATAIEAGDRRIGYGELDARANRLARVLAEAGAGPERTVGLCLDRSAGLVVALLAVLKAGAAFVPLDAGLPVERIRTIAGEADLCAIVTAEPHLDLLADIPVPLVLEPDGEEDAAAPAVAVSTHNTAFVYYTSGSTGVPKGVVIDHRCAMRRIQWLVGRYRLGAGDRVLHKTPLIFDVAIWEIFGPLSTGATILLADPGAQVDPMHLRALLGRGNTTLAHFVPSMLDAFLDVVPPGPYPGLRWVMLTGEAVSNRLLSRYSRHFDAELHNAYGQTETSEVAVWEGRAHPGPGGVPIGRQVGVYRLFVLDAELNVVPPGVPGELCVAGLDGLARGYRGRPDLTAEKFVPNPYAIVPGERLYRTGDLAFADADGVLVFAGRIDQQTKIRGCRVEVGEVETILAGADAVRSCAVAARPDETGGTRLVAYVVGDGVSVTALAEHAARYLPAYMLPETYVLLDALPLTPSGKLDRARLPAPTAADRERRTGSAAPESPLEAELGRLWKELLGLDHLGHTDNFFAIGGNSLKSLQVLNRVNTTFGIEISVLEFFGTPTIRGLATSVERALTEQVASLSDDEAARRLGELRG
ncbi:amino acid adenylation domain-containing protein [Amycolatopsis sp. cmx-4-68]|uniref:amino acid adenylation domain-containing protein n=1 Tax=Amycolatopsis sp. cmx-4-68 TaxID=2790938 RepID=UPI00397D6175